VDPAGWSRLPAETARLISFKRASVPALLIALAFPVAFRMGPLALVWFVPTFGLIKIVPLFKMLLRISLVPTLVGLLRSLSLVMLLWIAFVRRMGTPALRFVKMFLEAGEHVIEEFLRPGGSKPEERNLYVLEHSPSFLALKVRGSGQILPLGALVCIATPANRVRAEAR